LVCAPSIEATEVCAAALMKVEELKSKVVFAMDIYKMDWLNLDYSQLQPYDIRYMLLNCEKNNKEVH
jgi:hypothetical protein